LLFKTVQLEQEIEKEMFLVTTSDVLYIAQNNAISIKKMLKNSDNYIEDIKNNVNLQKKIEDNIKLLITRNIKYAYILYKDEKDKFRFLVDGSIPSEKAAVNQKFDVDSKAWFDVYTKKKPQLVKHEYLKSLSISYIVPILKDDSVELILAIDFSLKKVETMNKIISLMENGIIFMLVIVLIFLLILIFQMINYNKVKKSAFIDKLTNVYNRNYLHENQSKINLEDYVLAVADIDYFKSVNDTYGHDVGDTVLRETAKIFSNTMRIDNGDIIIRYGGEEFILLIKKAKENKNSSLLVLDRVLQNIEQHDFSISLVKHIKITVSIGVNLNPDKSKNFTEAFKLADKALYEAKNDGRNNIKVSKS
jgi:diguanylate cyclase (GGDEF)-like protein